VCHHSSTHQFLESSTLLERMSMHPSRPKLITSAFHFFLLKDVDPLASGYTFC
jgi:hypothetical protein